MTYAEWSADRAAVQPFAATQQSVGAGLQRAADDEVFCVIVNSDLYPSIELSLDQYVLDLTDEGYVVDVYTTIGGTPADLRAFLTTRWTEGMEGCVLIGDLPVPWYEHTCGEDNAQFPIDLFYMDLNGVFTDADSDGMYDSHTGNVSPEIYVGRLTASPLTYGGDSEANLLINYFVKNHRYRTGQEQLNQRALVYVEDDWVPWAGAWSNNVGLAYDDRTLVSDEYQTWATDYEYELGQNYESVLICVHSSPALHQFTNPVPQYSYTYYYEIRNIDPKAYFYNLFACSNARYVESNYMAGWYIFCQDYGLVSVGSTKTGAMLQFEYFYNPFGNGVNVGESFRQWFTFIAAGGITDNELCWHYGMTLCGDPTLVKSPICVDADLDGFGDPGEPQNECAVDNCPMIYNPGQEDADGDGIGDVCDDCTDSDGDGYGDPGFPANYCDLDNCPGVSNPGQEDFDHDGVGNACCCGLDNGGLTGDANCDGGITLSDISRMIDFVYISKLPLCCPDNGNVNGSLDGDITLSDISRLIDAIYVSKEATEACQ